MEDVIVLNNLLTGHSIPKMTKVSVLQERNLLLQVSYNGNKTWINSREACSPQEIEEGLFFVNITGKLNIYNMQEMLSDIADLISDSISQGKTDKRINNSSLIAQIEKLC